MCWWVREEEGKKKGERILTRTNGFSLMLIAFMATPVILEAAYDCYRSAKNGCRQAAEGTCCRVEKKGDDAVVYFNGEPGRYRVREKNNGERLEYCYARLR
jgi:hypothetical protein